jgi:FtsZ-interacting cell division protein ZipA
MSAGVITVIVVIAAIVLVAIVAGVLYDARRRRLRQRFGPEYDRLVESRESRRKAEAELAGREKRVRDLDIRPLEPAARSRYAGQWATIQERFVDEPQQAVAEAQRLVMAVMSDRGYPTKGSEQVLADLSVDHARTLDHYRAAYAVSQRAADEIASTEDLRQAMIHYRALFRDLLGQPDTAEPEQVPAADEPEQVPAAE